MKVTSDFAASHVNEDRNRWLFSLRPAAWRLARQSLLSDCCRLLVYVVLDGQLPPPPTFTRNPFRMALRVWNTVGYVQHSTPLDHPKITVKISDSCPLFLDEPPIERRFMLLHRETWLFFLIIQDYCYFYTGTLFYLTLVVCYVCSAFFLVCRASSPNHPQRLAHTRCNGKIVLSLCQSSVTISACFFISSMLSRVPTKNKFWELVTALGACWTNRPHTLSVQQWRFVSFLWIIQLSV